MPQITLDLTDDAYFLLQNLARGEALSLEAETALMVERSLAMTLPEGVARWNEFRTAVTTIKGFISTLRMDEDGMMFEHRGRLEFYEIIERECDRLRESIEVISRQGVQNDRFRVQPTSLRAVLETVQDRALASPSCKPGHKLTLVLGAEVPTTFLTDKEALTETLGAFLEEVMVCTPDGRELRIQIHTGEHSQLTFSISHLGQGISPEFAHLLTQRIRLVPFPKFVFGRPSFLKSRAFLLWHGGTCDLICPDSRGETTFSFTLPPAIGSDFPLWDDIPFRMAIATLRRSCIQLLSGAERLAQKHSHFDDKARADLAVIAKTQLRQIEAFLPPLETNNAPDHP